MASWLQNQLKAAEELLQAVDRTAKSVSVAQTQGGKDVPDARPRLQGPSSGSFRQQHPVPAEWQGSRSASRSASFAERNGGDAAGPPAVAAAGDAAAPDEGERSAPATSFQRRSSGIPFGREPQAAAPVQGRSVGVAAAAVPRRRSSSEQLGVRGAVPQAAAAGTPEPTELPPVEAAPQPAASSSAVAAGPTAQEQLGGLEPSIEAPELNSQLEVGAAAVEPVPVATPAAAPDASPLAALSSSGPVQQAEESSVEAESSQAASGGVASAAEEIAAQPAAGGPSAEGEAKQPLPVSTHAAASGANSEGGAGSEMQPEVAAAAAPSTDGPSAGGLQRIEQELDEARVLAGGAATQREARLQKVVERLKQRLEQYKQENEQLEELLQAADAKARGGTGEIERLEDEVARAQAARISAEAALQHALMAKEGEVRSLKEQLEAANKKWALLDEQLGQLQEANETLVQERKVSEGQLIQSLRKEVEGIERVLEEERAAHAATRKAAAAREHELEGSLQDSASSMTRMQRDVEDRSAKLAALEERCSALEHEVDSLAHQLRTTEGKLQKQVELTQQSSSEALQQRITELESLLAQERGATAVAEQGRAAANEELVRLRAEVGSLRRQLAEVAHQDTGDLQRRLKEVTDLLYLKQTQLERIASEKAAQQLQLERELAQARTEAEQVKRRARTDRAIAAAEDAVVPMDAIGDAYHRLANNNRVGGAVKAGAKFLDATASQVVRILKQYPVGRLVVFAYVIGVHLFIYLLLHRLQRRAFSAEHAFDVHDGSLDSLQHQQHSLHEQLGG